LIPASMLNTGRAIGALTLGLTPAGEAKETSSSINLISKTSR
jgi:hypothetical protein